MARRISELSTDQAMDILCTITPSVNTIVSDAELLDELRSVIPEEDMATRGAMVAAAVRKINRLVPLLMRKHRKEVAEILAAFNGKTKEAVLAQPVLLTMKQIRSMVRDKELMDFFGSCTGTEESE